MAHVETAIVEAMREPKAPLLSPALMLSTLELGNLAQNFLAFEDKSSASGGVLTIQLTIPPRSSVLIKNLLFVHISGGAATTGIDIFLNGAAQPTSRDAGAAPPDNYPGGDLDQLKGLILTNRSTAAANAVQFIVNSVPATVQRGFGLLSGILLPMMEGIPVA